MRRQKPAPSGGLRLAQWLVGLSRGVGAHVNTIRGIELEAPIEQSRVSSRAGASIALAEVAMTRGHLAEVQNQSTNRGGLA